MYEYSCILHKHAFILCILIHLVNMHKHLFKSALNSTQNTYRTTGPTNIDKTNVRIDGLNTSTYAICTINRLYFCALYTLCNMYKKCPINTLYFVLYASSTTTFCALFCLIFTIYCVYIYAQTLHIVHSNTNLIYP